MPREIPFEPSPAGVQISPQAAPAFLERAAVELEALTSGIVEQRPIPEPVVVPRSYMTLPTPQQPEPEPEEPNGTGKYLLVGAAILIVGGGLAIYYGK